MKPKDIDRLVALFEAGSFGEVESQARRLLARHPAAGIAWDILGASLRMQGKDALIALQKAAQFLPDEAGPHYNLGYALQERGRLEEAVACYRRSLQIQANFAEPHVNLGNALKELGRMDEAVASYGRALRINPEFAPAHYNLGNALQDLGQFEAAEASLRRALAMSPDVADVHHSLGNALQALGRLDEAVASYRRALEIKPDFADAFSNLGNALRGLGFFDEAVASYRRALALEPELADVHCNLGIALKESFGNFDAAVASYRRALEIQPDFVDAHYSLGVALQDMGQLDEAVASYRRVLALEPDREATFGNLLFALNYHPDLSAEEIFAAYREYDARFGAVHSGAWREWTNSRESGRRLKVGYVSPDFRQHSARHVVEPLLAHHDKSVVEVYAYAELKREDAVTARYRGYVDHWIPTLGLSDEALAERIRADGIDILVDLAGHTAHNRLRVFARKPAPVSVSWLGYGYTTGLAAVDYMLTDAAYAPAGSEGLFSETLWRVQTPVYAYRAGDGMGAVSALPAAVRGYVTFGTLTRAVRINHRSIRVWSEILRRVEGARLVIDSRSYQDAAMQAALAQKFAAHGIARERLEIGYHSPPWDVLRGLDISLDCFPHNSGTTLFESLYMGVPYISLAGRPSVGRLGSSQLQGAGHPEWIAHSEDEYVEKAVALAGDLPRLAQLRAGLRAEVEASPLMDEAGFVRKTEAAYRDMFAKWARG